MTSERNKSSRRLLDPVDRVSEILFGLIMVLTSTNTLSVATAGRAEIGTMIMGALGCNLAWGIIDAALYVMGCLNERGRNLLMLRAVRQAVSPEEAKRLIADSLPESLASVLSEDEAQAMRQKLAQLPEPPVRSPPHQGRCAARGRHMPAGFRVHVSGGHTIPVLQRSPAGAAAFQCRRNRHDVFLRLRVRAVHRTSSVAHRTSDGRYRMRDGWRRDRSGRLRWPS